MGLAWSLGSVSPWVMGVMASNPDVGIIPALGLLGFCTILALVASFFVYTETNRETPETLA